jgi:hypothetical protein
MCLVLLAVHLLTHSCLCVSTVHTKLVCLSTYQCDTQASASCAASKCIVVLIVMLCKQLPTSTLHKGSSKARASHRILDPSVKPHGLPVTDMVLLATFTIEGYKIAS